MSFPPFDPELAKLKPLTLKPPLPGKLAPSLEVWMRYNSLDLPIVKLEEVPMTKESPVITERPGETLPSRLPDGSLPDYGKGPIPDFTNQAIPPIPDNAPYIGDIVQGSTSVPQPPTYTGGEDPGQMESPSPASSERFQYYVRISFEVGCLKNIPTYAFLVTNVDLNDAVNASVRNAPMGAALPSVQRFMRSILEALKVSDPTGALLEWEAVEHIPALAEVYTFHYVAD